jgi:hypothetical protein
MMSRAHEKKPVQQSNRTGQVLGENIWKVMSGSTEATGLHLICAALLFYVRTFQTKTAVRTASASPHPTM